MKRIVLLLTLALLPAAAAVAGTVTLDPPAIDVGGVSLLRWHGEPPAAAAVRFHGREISLWRSPSGAFALLGSDLETKPGKYEVTVAGTDRQGRDFVYALPLEVRPVVWPEEHLALPPAMVSPRDPKVVQRIAREQNLLRDLFSRPATAPLWDHFALPVADPLGSRFGLRRILNGEPRSPHAGIDFRSPRGTPVGAAGRARAVFAGDLYYTGKTVILDHGGGLFSLYAHLDEVLCREGELLERGSVLGRVGSTGRSTGPHLHWGIKLGGARIDPLSLLGLLGERP